MPYAWASQLEISPTPTRNVILAEHQEAFIGDLVRSRRYSNASEVLRESLRLMERRESLEAAKLNYPRNGSWTALGVRPAGCPARHNEAE